MEWLEMLTILEKSVESAAKLPTLAERSKAIATAYETAAANLGGNTTAKQVLQQIYNGSGGVGRTGDLSRLILRHVPEQTARAAITSSVSAGTTAGTVTGAATEARGLWGVLQAIGRWIFGSAIGDTAAMVVGGVTLTAVLAALTYGVANLAGYLSSDPPVQPGAAMNQPHGKPVVPPNPGDSSGKYAVFLLKNVSGGSIWIGREKDLKEFYTYQFPGGGLRQGNGRDAKVEYTQLSKSFDACGQAFADYQSELKKGGGARPIPLTQGSKAKVYGGDYWVDTISGCP